MIPSMAPDRMGKNFDESIFKSPLTVGRPGREPGPDVHNVPIAQPEDPLRLIPGNSKQGTKRGK